MSDEVLNDAIIIIRRFVASGERNLTALDDFAENIELVVELLNPLRPMDSELVAYFTNVFVALAFVELGQTERVGSLISQAARDNHDSVLSERIKKLHAKITQKWPDLRQRQATGE